MNFFDFVVDVVFFLVWEGGGESFFSSIFCLCCFDLVFFLFCVKGRGSFFSSMFLFFLIKNLDFCDLLFQFFLVDFLIFLIFFVQFFEKKAFFCIFSKIGDFSHFLHFQRYFDIF